MKASEIKAGEYYKARVGANVVTVRVDEIRHNGQRGRMGSRRTGSATRYEVTNTVTGRKTTFRSAQKFRRPAAHPGPKVDPGLKVDFAKQFYDRYIAIKHGGQVTESRRAMADPETWAAFVASRPAGFTWAVRDRVIEAYAAFLQKRWANPPEKKSTEMEGRLKRLAEQGAAGSISPEEQDRRHDAIVSSEAAGRKRPVGSPAEQMATRAFPATREQWIVDTADMVFGRLKKAGVLAKDYEVEVVVEETRDVLRIREGSIPPAAAKPTHRWVAGTAEQIVALLRKATMPGKCTWGDQHPDAHGELFDVYGENMVETVGDAIIERLEVLP